MSKMHKCVVPKLGEYIYALFPHSYTEAVLQVIKHASDELCCQPDSVNTSKLYIHVFCLYKLLPVEYGRFLKIN